MLYFKHPKKLIAALSALAITSPVTCADGSSSGFLEEITVTARKRAENLQQTPISISAFTANGLEQRQVDNIAQVAGFTPNLIFDTGSAISGTKSSASIFIRGIGQTDFTLNTDAGVGLYLDGVYLSRSIGAVLDIVDVERVEILRGPQGTLFGRNTIGGAISLTSKKPEEAFNGHASVTFGRYDRLDFKAGVNIPLGNTLYSAFSIARFDREGHIDRPLLGDETGEDDSWAARAAFRWLASDTLEFNLNIEATRERETSCCGELVATYPAVLAGINNFGRTPDDPLFFDDRQLPSGDYEDNSTFDVPSDLDLWGIGLTAEWAVSDSLNFKSITAFRDLDSVNGRDEDHSPVLIGHTFDIFDHEQFSQELQLQGVAMEDRLKWITGLYYFAEEGLNVDDVNFGALVHLTSGGEVDNESLAAFAQASYDLTDRLSLTAGLRWTKDTKRFKPDCCQYVISSALTPFGPGTPLLPNGEQEEDIKEVLPMINISYQWSEALMTYFSYSEGFKSGGFTQRVFPPRSDVPSFDPEFVEVYELGFKWTGFDGRVRLNGAAFFTDYTDLQVAVFDGIAPVTQNAAAAEIDGFELELLAVPTENLTIEFGIGYLDAEYTEIDPAATEISLSKALVNTPELSVNFSLSYLFELKDIGTIAPRIDWFYKDDYHNDALNTAALHQGSYDLVNASITFEDLAGNWQLTLSGKNLSNERYIQAGFASEDFQSIAEANFGRPREWALTVKRQF